MDNGLAIHTDGAAEGHDEDTHDEMKAPTSPNKSNGHRRSLSNTILGRLNFLRTSQEETRPSPDQLQDDNEEATSPTLDSSPKAIKGRKRKGSLRKTALLGTGKLKAEPTTSRPRLQSLSPNPEIPFVTDTDTFPPLAPSAAVLALPAFSPSPPTSNESPSSTWSADPNLPPLDTSLRNASISSSLASPIKSPTSQSYASTTDDEEALSFSRPALAAPAPSAYFPPAGSAGLGLPSITRRRSTTKPAALSPLSALPMDNYEEEEVDYSETEWWGWVVLVVTWIVFVVGMGSCLEVWSWAWDVGPIKPYAPPELEDDPTLPIVGYYPALIILTAVMAWVWVVVAWVGMKYFKHAKIQGDDT